jgi:hypothetical protein
MASYTKVTQFRRKLRRANMGRDRKTKLALHGTTPPFAVHSPEAIANAPIAQLRPQDRPSAMSEGSDPSA